MAVRITSMVVRLAGLGAIILGLLFWSGRADNLIDLHRLFGILIVLGLWGLGVAQATRGGSPVLAVAAIVLGAFVFWFGTNQDTLLVGSAHWIIKVCHLLVGLCAIGLAEVSAAQWRERAAALRTS